MNKTYRDEFDIVSDILDACISEGCTQSDLTNRINIHHNKVVKTVNRLIKANYIDSRYQIGSMAYRYVTTKQGLKFASAIRKYTDITNTD